MISSQKFEAIGGHVGMSGPVWVWSDVAMVYFIYLKFFMHGSLSTNIY